MRRHWLRRKIGPPARLRPADRLEWTLACERYVDSLAAAEYVCVALAHEGTLITRPGERIPERLRGHLAALAATGTIVAVVSEFAERVRGELRGCIPVDRADRVVIAGRDGLLPLAAPTAGRRQGPYCPPPQPRSPAVAPSTLSATLAAAGLAVGGGTLLAIGAEGQEGGRDHALLGSGHALTVQHSSRDPRSCWYLGSSGGSGPKVTAGYLRKLAGDRNGAHNGGGAVRFLPGSFQHPLQRGVACVITEPGRSKVILQRKDASYPVARYRGSLTCFGGQAEAGEPPGVAIRREISEEIVDAELRLAVFNRLTPFTNLTTSFGHQIAAYEAVLPDFAVHAARLRARPGPQVCAEGEMEVVDVTRLPAESFAWDADLVLWRYFRTVTGMHAW